MLISVGKELKKKIISFNLNFFKNFFDLSIE
jgi:hypothetical protein